MWDVGRAQCFLALDWLPHAVNAELVKARRKHRKYEFALHYPPSPIIGFSFPNYFDDQDPEHVANWKSGQFLRRE